MVELGEKFLFFGKKWLLSSNVAVLGYEWFNSGKKVGSDKCYFIGA